MDQTEHSRVDATGAFGSLVLKLVLPAAMGIFFAQVAFAHIFPLWFQPTGVALQLAMFAAVVALATVRCQSRGGVAAFKALILFFAPVPAYWMLAAAGDADFEQVQRFSAYLALALPVFLLAEELLTRQKRS